MALINCPECNRQISDLAKICPNCGIELNTVKNINSNTSNANGSNTGCKFGCLTYIMIIVIIIIIGVFVNMCDSNGTSYSTSTYSSSSNVNIGEIIVLSNLYLGASVEDYKRIMELIVAKDDAGVKQMLLTGKALYLSNNIKVKVISNGFSYSEVRILSGIYSDESAWIGSQFIKK